MADTRDSSAPSSTLAGLSDVEKFPNGNFSNTDSGSIKENNQEPQLPATEILNEEVGSNEEEPQRAVTGIRWVLVCIAIYSANILYGLDTTIAADSKCSLFLVSSLLKSSGWNFKIYSGRSFFTPNTTKNYITIKY